MVRYTKFKLIRLKIMTGFMYKEMYHKVSKIFQIIYFDQCCKLKKGKQMLASNLLIINLLMNFSINYKCAFHRNRKMSFY